MNYDVVQEGHHCSKETVSQLGSSSLEESISDPEGMRWNRLFAGWEVSVTILCDLHMID